MVSALHHVTVLTADPDKVIRFVMEILDMPLVSELEISEIAASSILHWPNPMRSKAWLFGARSHGMLEVAAVPEASGWKPSQSSTLVAFAIRDLASTRTRALSAGFAVSDLVSVDTGSGTSFHAAVVSVGEVKIELVQFAS